MDGTARPDGVVSAQLNTLRLDLQGRNFLHDYRWQDDTGFGVLELIITSPMIVTR